MKGIFRQGVGRGDGGAVWAGGKLASFRCSRVFVPVAAFSSPGLEKVLAYREVGSKVGRKEIMYGTLQQHLRTQLEDIQSAGLFKRERVITTPQDAHIRVADGNPVLNMCANNYLGPGGASGR